MWPFKKQRKPVPTTNVGGTLVYWDDNFQCWEFEFQGEHCILYDKTVFDPEILDFLPHALEWIKDLDTEINEKIEQHLRNWCEWDGTKDLTSVNVSQLLDKNQIELSFSGNEDWGDLGIEIVVTNGKITDSFAGD